MERNCLGQTIITKIAVWHKMTKIKQKRAAQHAGVII